MMASSLTRISARAVVFVVLVGAVSGVHAQSVLVQHSGKVDPFAEGWSLTGLGTGISSGGIDDAGTEVWFFDDNYAGNGGYLYFYKTLSPAQMALVNAAGWKLTVRLRVVDIPDLSPGGSPAAIYQNANGFYGIYFGSQADGDPMVWLPTSIFPNTPAGPTYVLENGGSGYHEYQLVYDSAAMAADLFIDGVERISNYTGAPYPQPTPVVSWGAFESFDVGQGNFNLVQLSTVPEPGAVVLLMFTTIGWCLRRGRPA